jgi:CheY-like chemotaxis protein
VLIVDDEFIIADLWRFYLEEMDIPVCATASNALDAVALAEHHLPQLVLMDVRLRGKRDGVDAALEIYDKIRSTVIFITGSKEPETTARIHLDHPYAILYKPVPEALFRRTVLAAMKMYEAGSLV